ncbi:MAG TPA: phospholipase D-like domain-containing protein, partial [Chloroflexota bacterium]|nr:phospholipase D-like domain-containing protein [Chloroflexota bacterium]
MAGGALLALLVLFAAACGPPGAARVTPPAPSGSAATATAATPGPVSGTAPIKIEDAFYVFPDDGVAPLLRFIDSAQRTLDVYVFDLSHKDVEQRLLDAQTRGVAVRAVVEPNPTGREKQARATYDRLKAAGIRTEYAPKRFSKTHVKALVADGERAWIGSPNFVSEWTAQRDYAYTTTAPATVRQLASIFDDDFRGARGDATVDFESDLIVSPINSRSAFTRLLVGASTSIAVEHEELDDKLLADLLVDRSNAGLAVTVLVKDVGGISRLISDLRPAQTQVQDRPQEARSWGNRRGA